MLHSVATIPVIDWRESTHSLSLFHDIFLKRPRVKKVPPWLP
jgi:hypothetical protein